MKQSGFGITSLILGILGFLSSCIIFGIVPSFLGLIFAIIGLCAKNRAKWTAIAGLILSILGIGISLFALLIGFAFLEDDSSSENSVKTENNVKQIGTLLAEDENLSVYLDHIENGKIYVKYSNKSEEDYSVSYKKLEINDDFYVSGIFVDTVYAGREKVIELDLYTEDGEKASDYKYDSGNIEGVFQYAPDGIGFITELKFDEIEF